jgi:hypothetical protein
MTDRSSAPATSRPLRRRLTSALLVLGLTIGTMAMAAKPAEAASVVITCYTAWGTNFQLPGLRVELRARDAWGRVSIANTAALDASGCAVLFVPPWYRNQVLQTRISYMDTGRFQGGYYDGRSNYAIAYYGSWPIDYGTTTGGWALAGEEVWVLYGSVSCSGCRWV